jgi:tetratricopeptide (TPR) repeat protein
LALASGDGVAALGLLQAGAASQADPASTACWESEALMLIGDWEAGVRSLSSTATATCPQALQRLSRLADEALSRLDLPAAAGMLQALVASEPANQEAAGLLGASLLLTDPDAAAPVLTSAAASGDQLAADLQAAAEAADQGEEAGRLALAGQVLLLHEHWPLAALTFERLVAAEPANAMAFVYLGLSRQRSGQDGRAALEQAVDLAPDSAVAQSALGLYFQEAGEPAKAVAHLRRAVQLEPDNAAFTASLAAAQAAAGDVQAALASFNQAAHIESTAATFWRLLANFCLERRIEVAESGLPAARNATALQAEDPASLDLLGYAHLLLGNHVLAERLLSRAVRLDPHSASARLHYGLLLQTLLRQPEGAAQLEAASGLGGETPTGVLARRALRAAGP